MSDLDSICPSNHPNPNYYAMCMVARLAGGNGRIPFKHFPFSNSENDSETPRAKLTETNEGTNNSKSSERDNQKINLIPNLELHQKRSQNESDFFPSEHDDIKMETDYTQTSDKKDSISATVSKEEDRSEKLVLTNPWKISPTTQISSNTIFSENIPSIQTCLERNQKGLSISDQSCVDVNKNIVPSCSSNHICSSSSSLTIKANELESGKV